MSVINYTESENEMKYCTRRKIPRNLITDDTEPIFQYSIKLWKSRALKKKGNIIHFVECIKANKWLHSKQTEQSASIMQHR